MGILKTEMVVRDGAGQSVEMEVRQQSAEPVGSVGGLDPPG